MEDMNARGLLLKMLWDLHPHNRMIAYVPGPLQEMFANVIDMAPHKHSVIYPEAALRHFPESITAADGDKYFSPGHIFSAAELPPEKAYLNGAVYFEDNPDGTMHIVSRSLGVGEWGGLGDIVCRINERGNDVRPGDEYDWEGILASEFTANAGINMNGDIPEGRFWVSLTDPESSIITSLNHDYAWTWNPGKETSALARKNAKADMRFFCNVPQVQPRRYTFITGPMCFLSNIGRCDTPGIRR